MSCAFLVSGHATASGRSTWKMPSAAYVSTMSTNCSASRSSNLGSGITHLKGTRVTRGATWQIVLRECVPRLVDAGCTHASGRHRAGPVTGEPQLRFSVTGPGDEYADYTGGSGTNTLEFSYTVLATETDPDGIYIYRNPLTLETGESILGTANNLPPEGDIGKEGAHQNQGRV